LNPHFSRSDGDFAGRLRRFLAITVYLGPTFLLTLQVYSVIEFHLGYFIPNNPIPIVHSSRDGLDGNAEKGQ
jgi:hypothetical protein